MKKGIFWLCAIFLSLLPLTSQALTITNPVIELSADPGQKITKIVRVENDSDQPLTFYSALNNFSAQGTDGKPSLVAVPTEDYGLATWIEVEKGPITLAPRAFREMEIKINVPTNAGPGGYYSAVLWSSKSPEDVNNNVNIGWQVGHLILLKVNGEIKEGASLTSFNTKNSKSVFNRLPVEFVTEFKNSGNIHLKPIGQIEIKNLFGKTSNQLTFNAKGGNVLPESSRIFSEAWIKNTDSSDSTGFFGEIKSEYQNFGLGRYSANLNLAYGSSQKNLTQSIYFWVLPWHLIIVFVLALAILIALLWFLLKRYNRWIIKQANSHKK